GVLGRKGANMMGMDQDDVVVAPWTTIKARVSASTLTNVNQSATTGAGATVAAATSVNSITQLYPGSRTGLYPTVDPLRSADNPQQTRFANIDNIQVKVHTAEDMPLAIQQITALLHERHHIK